MTPKYKIGDERVCIKIIKLNINLFPEWLERQYNERRATHIADSRERQKVGIFSSRIVQTPHVGEAEWNKMYPRGFEDWSMTERNLTSVGQQQLIDKINELTDAVNELTNPPK